MNVVQKRKTLTVMVACQRQNIATSPQLNSIDFKGTPSCELRPRRSMAGRLTGYNFCIINFFSYNHHTGYLCLIRQFMMPIKFLLFFYDAAVEYGTRLKSKNLTKLTEERQRNLHFSTFRVMSLSPVNQIPVTSLHSVVKRANSSQLKNFSLLEHFEPSTMQNYTFPFICVFLFKITARKHGH